MQTTTYQLTEKSTAEELAFYVSKFLSTRKPFVDFIHASGNEELPHLIIVKKLPIIVNFFTHLLKTEVDQSINWNDEENKCVIEICSREIVKAILIRKQMLHAE